MPDYGMTCSPSITYNEDGSEEINYDQGQVETDEARLQQIAQFEHEQEGYFYEDPESGLSNHLADDALVEEPIEEEPFEEIELPPQDQLDLQNTVGGPQQYQTLMQWAAETLPEDIIAGYDQVMSSGDYEAIQEHVQALYEFFQRNGGENFVPQERVSNAPQDFVDNLLDSIGSDTYSAAIEWAANGGLSEQDINAYDSVMERGSQKELMDSAFNLVRYYQQYNN